MVDKSVDVVVIEGSGSGVVDDGSVFPPCLFASVVVNEDRGNDEP